MVGTTRQLLAAAARASAAWPRAPRPAAAAAAAAARPRRGPAAARCASAAAQPDGERPRVPPAQQESAPAPAPRPSAAELVREAAARASAAAGRDGAAPGVNVVLGGDADEAAWRELDEKVNGAYPNQRTFKAIGAGGADFVAAMTAAVVGAGVAVHEECVAVRPSATLKYASVTIGPVWVTSADQVLAIYAAMRADERLRFFL
jgi:putative lipoic acid-binding regulatory protein